jgi:hypothetical protein
MGLTRRRTSKLLLLRTSRSGELWTAAKNMPVR